MKQEFSIRLFCTILLFTPFLLSTCNKSEALQVADTSQKENNKKTLAFYRETTASELIQECTFTQGLRFISTSVDIPYEKLDSTSVKKAITKMHRIINRKESVPHIRENKLNATYLGLTIIEGKSYEVKALARNSSLNLQLGCYY